MVLKRSSDEIFNYSVQFQMEWKISLSRSLSSNHAELGPFTFLFYKGRQGNVQRIITHVHVQLLVFSLIISPSPSFNNRDLKDPGKRGHIVAETLLATQMFSRLPARATVVADTNFVSETQKMFLILFRNILCPQQMFPSLRSPWNIMGNNVSSFTRALTHSWHIQHGQPSFNTDKHTE